MDVLHANDARGRYPDSWYAHSTPRLNPFSPLRRDLSCDVCIVGAGYTGLSCALHLAENGFDVCVIEAHRVGWGASGRNGGQLSSALRLDQASVEKMVGKDIAHQLWDLGRSANKLVRDLANQHGIDCDLKPGILHANHKKRFSDDTKREVAHLNTAYGYDKISYVDKDEIRQMVASRAYFSGSLDMGGYHLHPLKFALGLARAATTAGVRIFENTQALQLQETDPAKIVTEHATVKARFVVLAANGYLGGLSRKVASRVMPINNFIAATTPLSTAAAENLIRDDVAVADSKFVINYFRLSHDNRLLFGGGETYSYRFPSDIKSFVRNPMLEIFPQLSDLPLEFGWGGTLGITVNRMPYVDRLSANILTAGGYSGEGLGMGTFAGKAMALAIAGTAQSFDLLQYVPTSRFPGGTVARPWLLALAMAWYSLRDRL